MVDADVEGEDPCPECGQPVRDDDGNSWPYCTACGWPDEGEYPW